MIAKFNENDSLSISRRLALPVLRGPLAGMWWSPASRLLSPYLGRYQRTQCSILEKAIPPGSSVIDVGAGCGFFTLLFARLVGSSGSVVSVEQSPDQFEVLRNHVLLNRLNNVDVARSTVSSPSDVKHQYADMTLDDLSSNLDFAPTHIRLRVEADALTTLHGGSETIAKHRPILFLTTHSEVIHHQCCKWLAELGYALRPLVGSNVSNAEELICTPPQQPSVRAA